MKASDTRSYSAALNLGGFRYHLLAQSLSPVTVKNYLIGAQQWLKWCADAELDYQSCTRNDMLTHLGEFTLVARPSTVRLRLLCLRVFYDYLVEAKLVETNPARTIDLKRQVARPVEGFTHEELRAMIEACETHQDRAIILLLLGGGLRRTELARIKAEDVNFSAGTIKIYGKGGKWRIVAPGTQAMKELRLAMWNKPTLFEQVSHDFIWRRVLHIAQRGGVKGRVFPHRFRYTFAVAFSEAGGSVDLLQTILGHTSLEMAMHYSRQGREKRAVAAQAALNPADRLFATG